MNLSVKHLRVMAAVLRSGEACGADLTRSTGVGPGTLYPLLARCERENIMTARWEEIDPSKEGRPRKRLYALTQAGRKLLDREMESLRTLVCTS